jgi:hypothetical protein
MTSMNKTISRLTVIVALLLLVAPAAAQADAADAGGEDEPTVELTTPSSGWGFGVAPRVGLDIPTSELKPFVVAALELDLFLPVLDRRLLAAFDFSFTYPRTDGEGNDARVGGDYDYDIKVLELKFALDVIFRFFDDTHKIIQFAGLGFALQYLKTTQETSFDSAENTEHNAEPGFEILGGVDFELGPGYVFGDVRFVFTKLDHKFTGDTNAGNVTICAGYRFVF